MKTMHHPFLSLHHEMIAARHWCNANLMHDYHVWLGLLIGALILGFTILMILEWSRGVIINKELMYYVQSLDSF